MARTGSRSPRTKPNTRPAKAQASSSVSASTSHWPLLLRLWQLYIHEPVLPMLDRWLKQQQRSHREFAAASIVQRLRIGAALREAVNFLQLACALEYSYGRNNLTPSSLTPSNSLTPNWLDWDEHWRPEQARALNTHAFWGWVGLRAGWDSRELQAQLSLQDWPARCQWFARWQAQPNASADATPASDAHDDLLQPAALLWAGLRPTWASLLRERAAASVWQPSAMREFIAAQTRLPPLWLRPQQGVSGAALQQLLVAQGVDAHINEQGRVYAAGGRGIASTQAYRDGLVEVQDLASQQIAATVAAAKGQKVWDCCAGAGGKTLAIAEPMGNSGMLLATDLHSYKLDELKRRAKRAQLFTIRSFTWNGEEALRLPAEVARQQGFDWVLLDAPCTAAGTWRRNPDARWRFSLQDSADLQALQARLLPLAAQAVRPGGHLVYATCSWQLSENERQLDALVAQGWQLVRSELLGAPVHNADTMYVALLRRPSL